MVASSAASSPLQLGFQAIEQIGVDASIDFLAENLLGALTANAATCSRSAFWRAQSACSASARAAARSCCTFLRRLAFGFFFDDGLCATVGVSQTGRCLVARL